jgi:NDP-mannose synthase
MSEVALVMAGGRSERMRASAGPRHKALTELGGATLIERNVAQLARAAFREIVVALGAGEHELAAYAEERLVPLAREHGASLRIAVEDRPLGNIGFAGTFGDDAGDVVVVYVDNLCALDPRALLAHHREHGYDLTIAVHEEPFAVPYGEVRVERGRVVGYREKPLLRLRVSSGTCVVGRRARALMPPGRRLEARDLFELVSGAGCAVGAFEHGAPWIDVNDAAAARRAEAMLAADPDVFERPVRT